MKKFVKFVGIVAVGATVVSCNDSKYQIEQDKIAEEIAGIKSYSLEYGLTSEGVSTKAYFYYTENSFEIKFGNSTMICSHEGDKYYSYTQESKDAKWELESISSYYYESYSSEYITPTDIDDEFVSKLEYNSKTKKYEYSEEDEGTTYKVALGFENSKIKTLDLSVADSKYNMYAIFTNINSTSIELPKVEQESSSSSSSSVSSSSK